MREALARAGTDKTACKKIYSTSLNFTHSASNQALYSGLPIMSDRQLSESERVAVQRALEIVSSLNGMEMDEWSLGLAAQLPQWRGAVEIAGKVDRERVPAVK